MENTARRLFGMAVALGVLLLPAVAWAGAAPGGTPGGPPIPMPLPPVAGGIGVVAILAAAWVCRRTRR